MNELLLLLLLVGALIGYILLEAAGLHVLGIFGRAFEGRFTPKQRTFISLAFVFLCLTGTVLVVVRHHSALFR